MTFQRRINECNTFNKINFFKFYVNNFHVGYIKKKNLNLIKKFSNILKFDNQKVFLDIKFSSFNKRTLAINKIFKYLVKQKIIKSKHREFFPVFHLFKLRPLLKIQRAFGPFFGIQFFGTHLNVCVSSLFFRAQSYLCKRGSTVAFVSLVPVLHCKRLHGRTVGRDVHGELTS